VRGTGTRLHQGPRVHRTCMLGPHDVVRHSQIPVTSPARTLLDLASTLDHTPLRRAVRQAQSLNLVSLRKLVESLNRLGPRRGARGLARIVATGPAPTRSETHPVRTHPAGSRPM
jgi:hypothetical protein